MNIKRQYNLPNVRLELEGFNPNDTDLAGNTRPLMAIVTNVECHFNNGEHFLSGGREFLDGLVLGVSAYVQGVLSGIDHPNTTGETLVKLTAGPGADRHLLSTQTPTGETVEVELNTLELFDLVDAIDQLCTDNRTLPDITLNLTPVSRRYRVADVPQHQRAMPVVTGLGTLAIAAALLFFVPVPEVEEPQELRGDPTAQTEEEEAETPDSDDPSDTPTLSAAELETLLTEAELITDPTEINFIQRYLFREISNAWQDRDQATEDLAFRISATIDGSIVAYQAIENTPESAEERTPLPDLQFAPTQAAIANREAITDFKVVFTRNGVLQINPWEGYQGRPEFTNVIDDPDSLTELQDQLQNTLEAAWDEESNTFGNDLIFRVAVTETGEIGDYEAQNNAGFQLEADTPLPELLNLEAAGIGRSLGTVIPSEPLAQFRVVFKSEGVVEIAPF
ncbi:DUF4335 domain-containing protein [Spirulina sp. CCNP1310]|uniref:DUF4335 domain-containing protein n=1 Tax=Spirulina sp. CCNP1310 TaxID=3110249 RepID=UPI002B1FFCC2|nr:DUF4335 domain-containing protein [Spirulina sp. CCNP1310]MEA5418744.1 DUF4335 domain-containing protein [Spirulina sp. CCNP1310]